MQFGHHERGYQAGTDVDAQKTRIWRLSSIAAYWDPIGLNQINEILVTCLIPIKDIVVTSESVNL